MCDLRCAHRTARGHARVVVAPLEDVDEVLLARDERASTDLLVPRWVRGFLVESRDQRVRHPRWRWCSCARVHEPIEHEVEQQDAPVIAEAGHDARPVELRSAGVEEM